MQSRSTFSDVPLLPEIFRWNAPKVQPDFLEHFCKWSITLYTNLHEKPATSGFNLFTFAETANQITSAARISHFPFRKMQKLTNSNIYIYYPKQKQSLARMRVFLDVSLIGADGFQKDYIFFKWKLRLSARKKSYKHLYHWKDETTLVKQLK